MFEYLNEIGLPEENHKTGGINGMKFILALLMAVLCYGSAHEAGAAIAPITFSNNFGYWSGAGGDGYGTVEISVGGDGYVHVTVSANGGYFSAARGAGVVWDKFFFNVAPGVAFDPASIVVDESVGAWRTAQGNISLFGDFDYGIVGTAIGASTVDTLHFHIADAGITLADIVSANGEGWIFAGHLRGFDPQPNVYGKTSTSTFLGVAGTDMNDEPVPTPLPAAFWLMGSGLGGIVLFRRRLTGPAAASFP